MPGAAGCGCGIHGVLKGMVAHRRFVFLTGIARYAAPRGATEEEQRAIFAARRFAR